MEKYAIDEWELAGTKEDKRWINYTITERVKTEFHKRMSNRPEGRSKIIHFLDGKGEWIPEQTEKYMDKMSRKRASLVFKARTRMIKVKGNYKNGYPDQTCRACKSMPESQPHVLLECKALHPRGKPQENEMDPFSKNLNVLKETAINIEKLIEELNTV